MLKAWKVLSLLLAAVCAAPTAACADWPYRPSAPPVTSGRVDVEIYDRTEGRLLPTYYFGGRRYVVGKPGNEYAVRVRNTGPGRALTVMSVDGVNVITGDTAAPLQSGYVLGPGENADIAGWRKDMQRTAAFYFTTLPDSYAARTGRPDNVGVIGVAVFRERERVRPPVIGMLRKDAAADSPQRAEASRERAAAPASAPMESKSQSLDAAQAEARQQLGTGHGRVESSQTTYTAFERASETPSETIAIYYDSYQNLLAMGVPVGQQPIARLRPNPFPAHFVPDPR
ncbi:MAG: hypothetical protein ABI981_07400 [Betaproteobacteria bacterium]